MAFRARSVRDLVLLVPVHRSVALIFVLHQALDCKDWHLHLGHEAGRRGPLPDGEGGMGAREQQLSAGALC